MKTSTSSRVTIAAVSLALTFFTFSATAAGASEIPSSTTSTAADMETEVLTDQDRQAINQSLGFSALLAEASALQRNGDKIDVLDADGNKLPVDITKASKGAPTVQTYAVSDEIKRAVGACLGIDFYGAVGAWEAIESQINTWQNAAKFVLRRVGLIGAIACGGGVFAEYLL